MSRRKSQPCFPVGCDGNVTYDDLHASKDNLWTVLYQTGYLIKKSPDENGLMITLVIRETVVTSVPAADVLAYTGSAQALVRAGSVENVATGEYSVEIPTETDAYGTRRKAARAIMTPHR